MSTLPREAERRRRILTRAVPLALVALIAFLWGASAGGSNSPEKEIVERFAAAWERRDFKAMYSQLDPASRRSVAETEFAAAYREAAELATLREMELDAPGDPTEREGSTVVPLGAQLGTVAFGTLEAELEVPASSEGIAWDASLVFPGLRSGERLESEVELADRAPILAIDGTPLAEGPAAAREHPLGSAAIDVSGEVGMAEAEDLPRLARQGFPPGTPVGISGLERAFNQRLAGKPGGALLAVDDASGASRTLAEARPRPGAPVKTTVDPDLQEAAVAALGGRLGGIAVLDTDSGDVRAVAGQAFSAPRPPGSTFKLVTTTAALQEGAVSLDDEFEITDGINVGGRFIYNANGEFCGGSFPEAFAHSCNAVFAPLGPAVGNDKLVEAAERFGFNSPPSLYGPEVVRAMELPEASIPTEIGTELDLGVSAIGQGEVLATPLQMATVAQAIANNGIREPTSVVANRKLRADAEPVRVMTEELSEQITDLMVGVVAGGTGTAGAIAEAQVAGKTGTAELGPKPGQEDAPNPVQIKDAWFAAFAPAERPRLAVAVLLIEAEASGGEVAAPAAAEVLSAGL
ncbi:MAG TPA: penicillin-binding transpeptidase domain-containing protein [Solirubrobacterales bacterium]|nr:penicillin-binding transpeptidase domain-containing protein [Solirubrobacterales bacterium]